MTPDLANTSARAAAASGEPLATTDFAAPSSSKSELPFDIVSGFIPLEERALTQEQWGLPPVALLLRMQPGYPTGHWNISRPTCHGALRVRLARRSGTVAHRKAPPYPGAHAERAGRGAWLSRPAGHPFRDIHTCVTLTGQAVPPP